MKLADIHIRDPFILNDNGKYYMYSSRTDSRRDKLGLGYDVYVSDDIENWSEAKSVFTPAPDFWAEDDFWAPEVHKYKGKYYMFTSFIAKGHNRGTQILVADEPDGEFVPHSDGPVTPSDWMCLDGTLYISKDGKPYMVFCHEWVQISDGEMCAMPLTDDLKGAAGEPIVLFKASEPVWATGYIGENIWAAKYIRDNTKNYVTDGPFMYRTQSGRLLMTWSSFSHNGYCVGIAYSDNGEIDGNWSHDERLLFEKDGGHGMIFEHDGKKYFILHQPNCPPDERAHIVEIIEKDDSIYRV